MAAEAYALESHALALHVVSPERKQAIDEEHSKAEQAMATLSEMSCETPDDEQALADVLIALKDKMRVIEEERTALTRPLLDAKREVDDYYRPTLKALEEIESILKHKLALADTRREEENRKLRFAAKQAAAMGHKTEAHQLLRAVQDDGAPEGIHYRYAWEYEIIDLEQVPREWLTVDPAKMKSHLKSYARSQAVPDVEGLHFTRRRIVVVNGT